MKESLIKIEKDSSIYLNKDTTICLNGTEFKVILKMENSESYYHSYYNLYNKELIPSLRTQIRLLNEVLGLDTLQLQIDKAQKSNDKALIAQAESNYNAALKTKNKVKFKLIFWKSLAIIEGGVILVITAAGIAIIYL